MNELDKDYSHLEGKEIKIGDETFIALHIEYNMGISIVDKDHHPVICLSHNYVDTIGGDNLNWYNKMFRTMIECIESGYIPKDSDDELLPINIGGGIDCNKIIAHHGPIDPKNCPFYGS